MIVSSHKITNAPCQGGVETVSNNTQNIMPGFRMLAFKVWRGEVPSKTFASYNLPSKFLFKRNIQITHTLKTVQKVVPIIFEINLKIN